MNVIDIIRKEVNFKSFVKRDALVSDFEVMITEDTLITENGVPTILYIKLSNDNNLKDVRQSLRNIKFTASTRTQGLKTTSRIFGYNPRNPIRKNFCSSTSLAHESPNENIIITNYGVILADLYKRYFPEVYKKHTDVVDEKILKEWKIKDTPFTSGIINKNNQLKYHFDAGNIKNVLSNMVVFKNGVEGGFLSCPEFNIGFECKDGTAVIFDGQNILHGVTKITLLGKNANRFSIVYYTLQQMWNCLPITEEMARARKLRLERENKRAIGMTDASNLAYDKER